MKYPDLNSANSFYIRVAKIFLGIWLVRILFIPKIWLLLTYLHFGNNPSQLNKAALISFLAAKIWIRERELKRHQGCGEGRFFLLGLFILERNFWKKYIFFSLIIIYDVTLSWNHISESNYTSQLYITWHRLRDVISIRYHVMKIITLKKRV